MGKIVFDFYNEWEQLDFRKRCNWVTITPIQIYFEYEWHGYNCQFVLLGLGFYFRYNTEKSLKLFEKWEKDIKKEIKTKKTVNKVKKLK